MSAPMPFDARAVLIDALNQNPEQFQYSNLILKNGKGIKAIQEAEALEADLINFARDPQRGLQELGPPPKRPDSSKYQSDEEKTEAENEWLLMMSQYNLMKMALNEHVAPEDLMMIKKFMKPLYDAIAATSAIKGKRFHSFTKQINDEPGGLGGLFSRKPRQG